MKFLNLLLGAAIFSITNATIKIDPASHHFIDENSRVRIFHGMNAVYKIAPWYPSLTGFDPSNSLSSIDAENLKSWGFNTVRLGVMWPGLEPGARGVYDSTYLDSIQTIVENLAKNGIYVLLDLHQDLFHRKFCGEGVPDYVYEICHAAQPADTPAFPLPAVNASYPLDSDGNPALASCLEQMFATYYMSSEVGTQFQCLYDNVDNLWDAMAGFWVQVATRFSSFENVLGYELINEPWAGDVHKYPQNLLPHQAEIKYLAPLYKHLHTAIRAVDDEKIIFYEGLTIDYWPNGFAEGPGGPEYNDRQAFAYHIYCPLQDPSVKGEAVCDAINDEFMIMRQKDIARLGGGWMMTEFGAAEDIKGDMYALEKNMQQADKFFQSWMYWQFKYYQDITTCTPQGESMYQEDGNICEHKLRILSRTYPQAVAGEIVEYSFSAVTGRFSMEYKPLSQLPSSGATQATTAATTEVYLNRALFYPLGAHVEITASNGADIVSLKCSPRDNILHLTQIAGAAEVTVTVNVTPCNPLGNTTCNCI